MPHQGLARAMPWLTGCHPPGHDHDLQSLPARLPAVAAVVSLKTWQRNTIPGCMRNQNEATEIDSDFS
jgi:hypothetical protein